ncbi:MAG: periplasmic heavy metal sensor [Hyphomonadaceae bacterium]|nr:periplasmic heavy metal sensor [Hyphomonadaceae bacterium]
MSWLASWRTGFFISLAVNIIIIGALLGFVMGGGLNRARGIGMLTLGEPREVAAALPPDVRRALRRDLVRAWFATDAERAAWRAANEDVARQLRAETYDIEAMRAALRAQREAGGAAMLKFQDELAESLASLTPQQRAAVADALTRVRAPQIGGRGGNGDGEDSQPRWREKMRDRLEQQN